MPVFGSQIKTSRIPILGLIPEQAGTGTPPSSPVEGLFWHDTTLKIVKIYLNGSWMTLGAAGSSGPPSGNAGGSLSGTYPNPTVAAGAITTTEIADGTITAGDVANATLTDTQVATANKDGSVGTASMRTLGSGSQQAMRGSWTLNDIANATPVTGAWSNSSFKISGVADPTTGTDAANKQYVDTLTQGLDAKNSCRVATTANITLSGLQTVDGVSLNPADRVLVKNQTTTSANGIYAAASGAWSRTTDADAPSEFPSAYVWIEEGTTQGDTGWLCTVDSSSFSNLGGQAVTWVQFSGASGFIDGAGLLKTGNTLDVVTDNATLEIFSDQVRAKDLGITTAKLAANAVAYAKLNADTMDLAAGSSSLRSLGTGATQAAAGNHTHAASSLKYVATLGALTAGVEASVTHSLNTLDIAPTFRTLSDNAGLELSWRAIDVNTIGVTSDIGYSASAVRAVVMA